MGVKIIIKEKRSIPVNEMKDGQIAIIVFWDNKPYEDMIVQRWDNSLISLGAPSGESFTSIFPTNNTSLKVRILQPGELIEIV